MKVVYLKPSRLSKASNKREKVESEKEREREKEMERKKKWREK